MRLIVTSWILAAVCAIRANKHPLLNRYFCWSYDSNFIRDMKSE